MPKHDTGFNDVELARERVLKLLSFRARSSGELRARLLQEGHKRKAVDEALARLTEVGLVNDCEFARNLVRSLMTRKPCGKAGLLFRLGKYKVDGATAHHAVAEAYADCSEEDVARSVLDDRYDRLANLEQDVGARRLASLLKRRGFASHAISVALEEYRRRKRTEEEK